MSLTTQRPDQFDLANSMEEASKRLSIKFILQFEFQLGMGRIFELIPSRRLLSKQLFRRPLKNKGQCCGAQKAQTIYQLTQCLENGAIVHCRQISRRRIILRLQTLL